MFKGSTVLGCSGDLFGFPGSGRFGLGLWVSDFVDWAMVSSLAFRTTGLGFRGVSFRGSRCAGSGDCN